MHACMETNVPPVVVVSLKLSYGWWPSSQPAQRVKTAWQAGRPNPSPQHRQRRPPWSPPAACRFLPGHCESPGWDPEHNRKIRKRFSLGLFSWKRLLRFSFMEWICCIVPNMPSNTQKMSQKWKVKLVLKKIHEKRAAFFTAWKSNLVGTTRIQRLKWHSGEESLPHSLWARHMNHMSSTNTSISVLMFVRLSVQTCECVSSALKG